MDKTYTIVQFSSEIALFILFGFMISAYYVERRKRIQAEKAMEDFDRLHEHHTIILNSLAEGVFGIDKDGNAIFLNSAAEEMTGYRSEEIIGKSIYSLIHHTNALGEKSAEECAIYRSLISGNSYHRKEEFFWKKDGTSFPVEYRTTPIREDGMIKGLVVSFTDVTERIRTEELIRTTEKLTISGQLAAGIAHEIRNPLTALKGFLQIMKTDLSENQLYFEIMLSELNRIELIISELVLLGKPQTRQFKPNDIRTLLQHVVTLLDTQAILQNIRIETSFEFDVLLIHCDENQIKQVFINLLKNSIEAMPNGGEILIEARKEAESVIIRVIDQGNGIPAEKLQKLGEPFYTTKEKGTGLGLMVSYNIVRNHHGQIDVKSKPGLGTTFTIKLPTAF